MTFVRIAAAGVFAVALVACVFAADDTRRKPRTGDGAGGRSSKGGPESGTFLTEVPAHPMDIILGRPTGESVTLSVLTADTREGFVTWRSDDSSAAERTPTQTFAGGEPVAIVLGHLRPDTSYRYRVNTRAIGAAGFTVGEEHAFHTARPPGAAFTFTITADSHLDANATPAIYERTLANARSDAPDFHIDLGDTFMTEKRRNFREALQQYLAQRYYFGQLADSVPLFLVLGNHDGETGGGLDGTDESMAVWSNLTRKRYFPNPEPDAFYSGNVTPDPRAGRLQDYYAWEWGDALFVVLDPFWFTPRGRGADDMWSRTLGRPQYDWLARTLELSHARFKFVFIHHLVGGVDRQSRGGVEASTLYEWGGRDVEGRDVFRQERPGWPMPIHAMLVRHRVTAVFHGHDHLFAEQELDGILYQEVPQPGHSHGGARNAAAYGYNEGTIIDGSGHVRVTVSASKATVEFVDALKSSGGRGTVVHRRILTPRP
jgi:hypothetical protein